MRYISPLHPSGTISGLYEVLEELLNLYALSCLGESYSLSSYYLAVSGRLQLWYRSIWNPLSSLLHANLDTLDQGFLQQRAYLNGLDCVTQLQRKCSII